MTSAQNTISRWRGRTVADRRAAIVALAAAGSLWGLTVPLSKLGLDWLGPVWLAAVRLAVAAPLLAVFARGRLGPALTPRVAMAGVIGYGLVIVLQNAGIERTSVSHAALIVGAAPVLVAVIAAVMGRGSGRPSTWAGSLMALGGVGLVAGAGGAGTTLSGDLLVLLSVMLSASFIVVQPTLLRGRDPAAVTAVQLGAGGLAALPLAILLEGAPPPPTTPGAPAAVLALAVTGTALAFWLFAWAQARVAAELASAFVNLEPLVGTVTGVVAFGDAFGAAQLAGGAAILAGIALGAAPRRSRRDRPVIPDDTAGGALAAAPRRLPVDRPPVPAQAVGGERGRPHDAGRSAGDRPAGHDGDGHAPRLVSRP